MSKTTDLAIDELNKLTEENELSEQEKEWDRQDELEKDEVRRVTFQAENGKQIQEFQDIIMREKDIFPFSSLANQGFRNVLDEFTRLFL